MTYRIRTRVLKIEHKHQITNVRKTGKPLPDGKAELASDSVSLGWFVLFEGSWESIFLGFEEPKDLAVGQEVDILLCPKS